MEAALKGAGTVLAGIVGLMLFAFVGALLMLGAAFMTAEALPYLALGTRYGLPICGMVLLPLTAFQFTRVFALYAIYAFSFLFGAFLWCMGFIVTLNFWGFVGVGIGLFIAGIGVVPVGILAAAFHSEWSVVGNLLIGAVVVYGARFFVMYKAEQFDAEEAEMHSMYAG